MHEYLPLYESFCWWPLSCFKLNTADSPIYLSFFGNCSAGTENRFFRLATEAMKIYYPFHLFQCFGTKYFDSRDHHIIYKFLFFTRAQWNQWCRKNVYHGDVIIWKHFPHYWPFVWGIQWSPVNSYHKGQWRGALMFSLICAWTNIWVNNRDAGDLRHHYTYHDVTVITAFIINTQWMVKPSD